MVRSQSPSAECTTLIGLLRAGSAWLRPAEPAGSVSAAGWTAIAQQDWPVLLDAARAQGVMGLLYDSAKRSGQWPALPEFVKEALRSGYMQYSLAGWLNQQELVRLQELLQTQQIPWVLLKGAALVHSFYLNTGLRTYGDIDILIDANDFPRVRRLLEAQAYLPDTTHNEIASTFDPLLISQMAFKRAGRQPAEVDVHWDLFELPFYRQNFPAEWFWQRSRDVTIQDRTVRGLSPEANFVFLSAHHATHRYGQLICSHDLALLLARYGDQMDWADVAAAVRRGLVIPVQMALKQVEELWGVPVPPKALACLGKLLPSAAERMNHWVTTTTLEPAQTLWSAVTVRGMPNKLREVRLFLMPDEAFMGSRYPIQDGRPLQWHHMQRLAGGPAKLARRIAGSKLKNPFRTRGIDLSALTLNIANITVRLDLEEIDPPSRARIAAPYMAFTIPDAQSPVACSVRLNVEPGPPYIPLDDAELNSLWKVEVESGPAYFDFKSYYEQGYMDLGTGSGRLTLRPQGQPENFLRVLYSRLCTGSDALLLHASGVIHQGRGYVFFGHSGAGKTTIADLSLLPVPSEGAGDHSGSIVLSDDMVVITRDGPAGKSTYRVHGVPFRGDMLEAPRTNASANLAGVFTPVKASEHSVAPISHVDAVAQMVACAPFLGGDHDNLVKAMRFCSDLVAKVPVRLLNFCKDPGFWRIIDAAY